MGRSPENQAPHKESHPIHRIQEVSGSALSQGQLSESVMDKMALTFTELTKLADFKSAATPLEVIKEPANEPDDKKVAHEHLGRRIKVDGLVYNIQIVLPESREKSVYDALFRSLREHLG